MKTEKIERKNSSESEYEQKQMFYVRDELLRYLDHSHSHTDSQDDPDVCDEPTLHAGGATLEANSSRASRRQRKSSKRKKQPKDVIYRVIDGPIWRLGLTEAAVGDVSGGDGDVLTGAGEEQHGAVLDDRVPVPVLVVSPATALHLREAGAKTQLYKPQPHHCLNNWSRVAPPGGDLRYNLTLFITERK